MAQSEYIKLILNLHTYSFYMNRRINLKKFKLALLLKIKKNDAILHKHKSVQKAYKNFLDDFFKII